jgi:ribosomal protein S18 acetylase RimI-like enzyme
LRKKTLPGESTVSDDHCSDPTACPRHPEPTGDPFRRWAVEYVHEFGPLAVGCLQADLLPYEPRRFERLLRTLVREGAVTVTGSRVEALVDTTALADPETVELSTLSVVLRPATGRDLRGLLALAGAVASESDHGGVAHFRRRTVAENRVHCPGDVHRFVYVADADGRLGGWVHLAAAPDSDAARLSGGVATQLRTRGVGSQLLRYGRERALERGYDTVYQYLPADDDEAFQFLRTHGWRVEGARSASEPPTSDELRVARSLDTRPG